MSERKESTPSATSEPDAQKCPNKHGGDGQPVERDRSACGHKRAESVDGRLESEYVSAGYPRQCAPVDLAPKKATGQNQCNIPIITNKRPPFS